MRWKTTISFLALVSFFLLSLWLFHSGDETPQRSEADEARGENSSKEKKKAAAKLYHGMNKRYRPGHEPDMQINITVLSDEE